MCSDRNIAHTIEEQVLRRVLDQKPLIRIAALLYPWEIGPRNIICLKSSLYSAMTGDHDVMNSTSIPVFICPRTRGVNMKFLSEEDYFQSNTILI